MFLPAIAMDWAVPPELAYTALKNENHKTHHKVDSPANSPGVTKIMPPPTSALRACPVGGTSLKPKPCTHKGDD